MTSSRFVAFFLLVGLIALLGCGGAKLAEVEGVLKVNGKPIDKIQVEFWPVGSGKRSIGETDQNGKYTLMVDDGKRQGAFVGTHKIILRDSGILGEKFLGREGETVDMSGGKKARINKQYSDPNTTPLTKTVNSGKNVIDLEANP
jgi:hypothetical protein